MASLAAIVAFLDTELRTAEVPDYSGALNGLQIENNGTVTHVAAAVDFSAIAIRGAVARGADLLIVHHGMFWGGPTPVTGVQYGRLATLIKNNVAVYSSHIPLDLHPRFGNNVLLAAELGLAPTGGFANMRGVSVGVSGESAVPTADLLDRARAFAARHGSAVVATPLKKDQVTRRWGMCTGAGASTETVNEALSLGLDTLIVGEGPHHSAVHAMDAGLTILYLGHYATETVGVAVIAAEVAKRFSIQSSFIESPTGL
jgi:dinuclear metal center YbgI/SA1388 family protein